MCFKKIIKRMKMTFTNALSTRMIRQQMIDEKKTRANQQRNKRQTTWEESYQLLLPPSRYLRYQRLQVCRLMELVKLLLLPFQMISHSNSFVESNISSLIKIIEKITKIYNIKYVYYENIINEEFNIPLVVIINIIILLYKFDQT